MSEVFLDDLRDKTRRGMTGRAHAGLATGGRLYGFSTTAQGDPRESTGSTIQIDTDQAQVVRRIFDLYLAGRSTKDIARQVNLARTPPPRAGAGTRHKTRPLWSNGTVAAMLANPRYAGTWRFGERTLIKVPGSNKRVSRPGPPELVLTQERPELAIVTRDVWDAVAERRAAVRHTFTRSADGTTKGRSSSGRMDRHPISGLPYCLCGAPFTMSRSKSASYLTCADSKRGRCERSKALREDVAVACVLGALRERLDRPEALAYLRKQVAARLEEVARGRDAEATEVRQRIQKTERRVANLITALADGDRSASVREAVRENENHLQTDRRALRELERLAGGELAIPTVAEVLGQLDAVVAAVEADPVAAREALRRYFKDGRITLTLGDDGVYTGASDLLPLVLFVPESEKAEPLCGIPPISELVAGARFVRGTTRYGTGLR